MQVLSTGLLIAVCASAGSSQTDLAALERQVAETERAFAKTMADRDHAAFVTFLAEDTVFLPAQGVLRGRVRVAEAWKEYYEGPRAPFAWEPDRVTVSDSGTLAFSTGPVVAPGGKRVGTFNSVWRREKDGRWRIIFDAGCPPCNCR
jgi:ketosteroid isomerase-like protein